MNKIPRRKKKMYKNSRKTQILKTPRLKNRKMPRKKLLKSKLLHLQNLKIKSLSPQLKTLRPNQKSSKHSKMRKTNRKNKKKPRKWPKNSTKPCKRRTRQKQKRKRRLMLKRKKTRTKVSRPRRKRRRNKKRTSWSWISKRKKRRPIMIKNGERSKRKVDKLSRISKLRLRLSMAINPWVSHHLELRMTWSLNTLKTTWWMKLIEIGMLKGSTRRSIIQRILIEKKMSLFEGQIK